MTDLDPEIWNNPTLGAAAQNENLDRLTKQEQENYSAKRENREPRKVVNENTYPDWEPELKNVPSNYQVVHFADEQPNDIPVDSAPESETAASVADSGSQETSSPESEPTSDVGESSTVEPDTSSPENGSTQWT